MIKSFNHKGLEKFYLKGTSAGIQAKHSKKPGFQLAALDSAHYDLWQAKKKVCLGKVSKVNLNAA